VHLVQALQTLALGHLSRHPWGPPLGDAAGGGDDDDDDSEDDEEFDDDSEDEDDYDDDDDTVDETLLPRAMSQLSKLQHLLLHNIGWNRASNGLSCLPQVGQLPATTWLFDIHYCTQACEHTHSSVSKES
jgi:hypothetical protein